MTSPHATGTRVAMRRLRDLDSRLAGLPVKGHHVGGGRHVELGDKPGPGWTVRRHAVRRHPTRAQWAYPVDAELRKARAEKNNLLSPAERTAIDAAASAAKVLPADWDDDPAQAARAIG